MTDFETRPAGTASRIAELEVALAAMRERAEDAELNLRNVTKLSQRLRDDVDCAKAATAAAYEVAAEACDYIIKNIEILKPDGENYETPRVQKVARGLVDLARQDIRALATPDQTAALDKLIAEAVEPYLEALIWCSGSADFGDGGFARVGWLKLCEPLILAASKKGGAK